MRTFMAISIADPRHGIGSLAAFVRWTLELMLTSPSMSVKLLFRLILKIICLSPSSVVISFFSRIVQFYSSVCIFLHKCAHGIFHWLDSNIKSIEIEMTRFVRVNVSNFISKIDQMYANMCNAIYLLFLGLSLSRTLSISGFYFLIMTKSSSCHHRLCASAKASNDGNCFSIDSSSLLSN